ncbi:hypothetical protein LguiA_024419 [Lonicera macranthoides]
MKRASGNSNPTKFEADHGDNRSEMRSNIVSEAGLSTRVGQWWEGIPFLTSAVVIVCGAIYVVCLLVGYDSFAEVCFWPSQVVSRFQVYRIYTSIIFHGSLLHVLFNMLALVPLGSELERVMGSIRLLYITILLATSNAILHLLIALLVAYNPIYSNPFLMNECAIGFSGILFSMIVIETSLSGAQSRSVFGLFNVPAKWYPWLLLVVFQLLMTNVSLLGHLSGILSGFAYTYGLFNILIPGTSFYSAIESSSWLAGCVRRPKFMMCTGGNSSGYIPTYSSQNTPSGGLLSGNIWRNLSSWMPQREASSAQGITSRRSVIPISIHFGGRSALLSHDNALLLASPCNQVAPKKRTVARPHSESNVRARMRQVSRKSHCEYYDPSPGWILGVAEGWLLPFLNSLQIYICVPLDQPINKVIAMGFDTGKCSNYISSEDGLVGLGVESLSRAFL